MALKASEISEIIKEQIKNYGKNIVAKEVGKVLTIGDGIALISGLENVQLGELVIFPGDIYGMILNLEEDAVGAVLLGPSNNIKEGDVVKRTKEVVEVPVGDQMLGRVINAIGVEIDGKSKINQTNKKPVFTIAPGVMTREEVNQPLETGIIAIDAMIPIGKGQRELIIGDRQTGKTAIAVDAIINQKGKNVYCVYVGIGQKNSSIVEIHDKLVKANAMKYTTIIKATASELPALQYIAPYTGITIAEEWMKKGKDVLIIFDDLSKHAVGYRTLSLLLRRPPGREAYPGDVFYLHSQLLERAARINKKNGGGSITALPIIETQAGDISAYIPTNVISITDGQLFMMSDLFNSGQRPAIDAGFSVSRVGSAAQIKAIKKVAGSLKLELAQYHEMAAFTQFGSDLDESTKSILDHGARVLEVIKQKQYSPYHLIDQVIILTALKERITNIVPINAISKYRDEIIKFFKNDKKALQIWEAINKDKDITDANYDKLVKTILPFTLKYIRTIKNYDNNLLSKMPEKYSYAINQTSKIENDENIDTPNIKIKVNKKKGK